MKSFTLKIDFRWAVIVIFGLTLISSCSSKKSVNFEEVKKGQHLNQAVEISVNIFFQIWMSNRYPQKIDLNCHELYKDDTYTYFGESTFKGLNIRQNLYKIKNETLKQYFPSYKNIDGQLIRNKVWDEVIPQNDQDIRKNAACNSSSSKPRFTYVLENDKIKITLEWKYKCDFKTLIDKTYLCYYDMGTLEIIK
jgi:hypothetical protein